MTLFALNPRALRSPARSRALHRRLRPLKLGLRRGSSLRPPSFATGVGKQAEEAGRATLPKPAQTSQLRANDLRHYLNQRIAATPSEAANDSIKTGAAPSPKPGHEKAGPVLKSLDAVLSQVLAALQCGPPQAVLVAGASSNVDATAEVIHIARSLVARREQVVLIDMTRGASAVSSPLGLPRAPGFTDLAAGRAGFDEIVKIDNDTPLQVIAAGNPKATAKGDETERFTQLFEAVTQD